MIHAICDFCGKDCKQSAIFLTMKAIDNWARHHRDDKPFCNIHAEASFVICPDCAKKHNLPNPYHEYHSIIQDVSYNKSIDNYNNEDIQNDLKIKYKNKKKLQSK